MLTVSEALGIVLSHCRPLPARVVGAAAARGLVLAEDVAADIDLPPFDKALVDGYAVRSDDLKDDPPHRLRVVEEITAGRTPSRTLSPGETAAIMTGAPLPEGADAVVMVEQARRIDEAAVSILTAVTPGQNRLLRGREMERGEVVLMKNDRLNPVRIGLLASVGRTEVKVIPRPEVVVVPTGDELVEPDRTPGLGQIRNSNAAMLRALIEKSGARPEVMPILPDDPDRLRAALARGLDTDVMLITGGVSAGKLDLVPGVLGELGVTTVFHKVRLKPGKPLLFGVGPERSDDRPGTLVFGLPGNPVSGLVCYLLFVEPALSVLGGSSRATASARRAFRLPLARPFVHRGDRTTYHPARMTSRDKKAAVGPLDWAGSADLRTIAQAHGLAVFPPGDRTFEAGEEVEFLPL